MKNKTIATATLTVLTVVEIGFLEDSTFEVP